MASFQMVLVAAFLLAGIYLLVEMVDLGLALVAPFLCKNTGDRAVLAKISRPALDFHEVWLLAAGVLALQAFPQMLQDYRSGVVFFAVVVVVGMLLRVLAAWGLHGENGLARLLTWANFLLAFAGLFFAALLVTGFLLNTGLGIIGLGEMFFSPFGLAAGLWMALAVATHGAIYTACKTTNPLAERSRATAIVAALLTILLYLILLASAYAISLFPNVGKGTFMVAGALSLLAYVGVFVSLRMRHPGMAFFLSYLAGGLVLAGYISWIYHMLVRETMDAKIAGATLALPSELTVLVIIAVVGTLVSHFMKWRRAREESPKDHTWGLQK